MKTLVVWVRMVVSSFSDRNQSASASDIPGNSPIPSVISSELAYSFQAVQVHQAIPSVIPGKPTNCCNDIPGKPIYSLQIFQVNQPIPSDIPGKPTYSL